MKQISKNPKFKIILSVGVLVIATLAVTFLFAHFSRADGDAMGRTSGEIAQDQAAGGTHLGDDIAYIFYTIVQAIVRVEAAFVDFLSKELVTFATYRGYFNEDFVRTGWGVVRDLVNLSFILVLMIIALMSIMRVEESVVRKLLPRFVFAVLTVNFSFFLCRVVVDFADGISMGFHSAVSSLGSVIFKYVQAFDLTKLDQASGADLADGAITAALTSMLLLGLLAIAVFAVCVAMGVRIMALSVLIILAPFAFLAMILPSSSGLASKWAKSLFSYAFWGPAALFFLWLAVITFTSSQSPLSIALSASTTHTIPGVKATSGELMKYIVVMLFMYMAVIAGKELGNTGGDLSLKAAKGAAKFAGAIGGGAAGVAGFRGFGKAIKGRYDDMVKKQQEVGKERVKQLFEGKGVGKKLQALNPAAAGGFKKKVKGREEAERIKKHKEDAKKKTKPEFMERWNELRNDTSADAMEEKQAMVELGAENGFLDDKAMFGENAHNGFEGKLNGVGFKGDAATKLAARVSSISRTSDSGDKRMVGLADYDKASGEYKANNEYEYSKAVSESMGKIANKGVVDSKKVGGKMFDASKADNFESAVYAMSGIDKQVDAFSGKEIQYEAMFQEGAHKNMENGKSASGTIHHDTANQVDTWINSAAGGRGKPDDEQVEIVLPTGKKLHMTVGQAKKYVASVDRANGHTGAAVRYA